MTFNHIIVEFHFKDQSNDVYKKQKSGSILFNSFKLQDYLKAVADVRAGEYKLFKHIQNCSSIVNNIGTTKQSLLK